MVALIANAISGVSNSIEFKIDESGVHSDFFAAFSSLEGYLLGVMPFIFATVFFISKKGIPLYANVQKAVDGMVRVVREDAQGIRVIKALSKTSYEHRRYDDVNRNLIKKEKKDVSINS